MVLFLSKGCFNMFPRAHTHTLPCRVPVYWWRKISYNLSRKRLVKIILVLFAVFAAYNLVQFFLTTTGLRRHVDPHSVRGYPYCPIDESKLATFEKEFACNFNPPPPKTDVVVVTFINLAWVALARNWVCSARKVGLGDKLYLVAFQKGVCDYFPDTPCYEHPTLNIEGTEFGEEAYQQLVIERTRLLLKFLSCGQTVLLADADITFLKNPLEYLHSVTEKRDMVFQMDSSGVGFVDSVLKYFFRYICGGFIFFKVNDATKLLWLSVLHFQENFKWNDQAGLNICIRHHTQRVDWDILESDYFPNGRQFFMYKERSEKNMIVHANHLVDMMKITRQIASSVWCDEVSGRQVCADPDLYQVQCVDGQDELPEWCLDYIHVCYSNYKITVQKKSSTSSEPPPQSPPAEDHQPHIQQVTV